ncbi:sugar O-acetyltransferase [Corynebacterium sputi]|uniref:sugar O-acetyltransferase n=1 Tax=Corynebacterium sputi TaxID=489915 RepID=UPI0003F8232A|nr:sugar O-acetyltransferase [Corynebacterium sputi]
MSDNAEKLAKGDWYLDDDELRARRRGCARILDRFNNALADDDDVRFTALSDLLGEYGQDVEIIPRFKCSYGRNIRLGRRVFINANAFFMDDAQITVADDARIGPGAQFMTALHPIEDHAKRREGWEKALPISIGSNTWLGASVTVGAGVTIGKNSVIGAGSVVLTDIPEHSVAVGTPAKVVRTLPKE